MDSNVIIKIDALDRSQAAFQKLNQRLNGVQKQTRNFRDRLDSLQPTFKRMAGYGAAATAAIGYGINQAVNAASRAKDIESLFNIAFKNTQADMSRFVTEFSKEFGRAETNIRQQAQNIGFAIQMGTDLGEQASADMAKEQVKVAEALAFTYDHIRSGEQAMQAITNAFNGNSDSLRQLVPTIREANIEQKAMEMGLANTKEQVDQNVRAQALHQLILDGTKGSVEALENAEGKYSDTQARRLAQQQKLNERLGKAFLPLLNSLQKAIIPVLESVSSWVKENPKLARNIGIATVALTGLVAVVGALGVALGVLLSPIGLVAAALAAVAGVVIYVETQWDRMPGILKVVLWPIKQIIDGFKIMWRIVKGVAGAVVDAVEWMGFEVAEAATKAQGSVMDLQATVDKFTDPLAGQSKQVDTFSRSVTSLGDDAENSADKVRKLREEASGIFSDFREDEADSKRKLAEAIIEQEENIKDKEEQLRRLQHQERTDDRIKEVRALKAQIEQEKTALQDAAFLKKRLASEVAEAERRASLTAFERQIEDIQKRRAARLKAQVQRLKEIQKEIAAERAKNSAIKRSFNNAQKAMQSAVKKTGDVAVEQAERMKDKFDDAVRSMRKLGGGVNVNFDNAGTLMNMPRLAEGGIVTRSTIANIGEAGPEAVIPLDKMGRMGGVTVNITGNTFMGEDDMVERVGDRLVRIIKDQQRV